MSDDERGEEKELDLSSSVVVTKYKSAAEIVNRRQDHGRTYLGENLGRQYPPLQHVEVEALKDDLQKLKIRLKELSPEVDSMKSEIEEFEKQIYAEKEEWRRISSKIMMIVEQLNYCSRLKDEHKRSQDLLQRLVDRLILEFLAVANEEDIDIDTSVLFSSHDSPSRLSDTYQRKQQFDGRDVYAGKTKRVRSSSDSKDGVEQQPKKRKLSSESNLDHQVEKVNSENEGFKDDMQKLKIRLKETKPEVDRLQTEVEEFEKQISAEKEECRRIYSKIRMFVKAHISYSRLQDEPKRAQALFQRLKDEIVSDALAVANEGYVRIGITEKETSPRKDDTLGYPTMGRQKDHMINQNKENDVVWDIVLPPPRPLPVAEDAYSQYKGEDQIVDIE